MIERKIERRLTEAQTTDNQEDINKYTFTHKFEVERKSKYFFFRFSCQFFFHKKHNKEPHKLQQEPCSMKNDELLEIKFR